MYTWNAIRVACQSLEPGKKILETIKKIFADREVGAAIAARPGHRMTVSLTSSSRVYLKAPGCRSRLRPEHDREFLRSAALAMNYAERVSPCAASGQAGSAGVLPEPRTNDQQQDAQGLRYFLQLRPRLPLSPGGLELHLGLLQG